MAVIHSAAFVFLRAQLLVEAFGKVGYGYHAFNVIGRAYGHAAHAVIGKQVAYLAQFGFAVKHRHGNQLNVF